VAIPSGVDYKVKYNYKCCTDEEWSVVLEEAKQYMNEREMTDEFLLTCYNKTAESKVCVGIISWSKD
jgi:hypothetical protein